MTKISFVFFDVGGVFFEWDQYFATAAKNFGIDKNELIGVFSDYDDQITTGKITPSELWSICQNKLNIKNADDYDFLSSWVGDYVPIEATVDFAIEVSKEYSVGIISDIYKGMFSHFLEQEIIPSLAYTVKALSCEIGMRKPNRDIYEYAQSLTKVDPTEILYIDDIAKNLVIPSELGWSTHQFATYNPEQSINQLKSILKL